MVTAGRSMQGGFADQILLHSWAVDWSSVSTGPVTTRVPGTWGGLCVCVCVCMARTQAKRKADGVHVYV